MSLPIFINPFEDPSDIDFFEFDVYVLMLEAFDPEGTEIQFQIVEEFGDGALFYITPDYNELAFITDPDFEDPSDLDQDNVYEVMVRAEDRDSEEDYRTIYVHVLDVDEGNNNPPEFVSAGFVEVAENPEVAVYIAEAQDPDGDPVTYEITGGADQHLFSIDPETGEVYFNDVLDYENPQDAEADNFYEIEITASDGYSESDPHFVLIQVTDLDDTAPLFEGDVDFSVEENTAEVPYAVVAYDPEGGDITYDLGGPDGHLFQLGPDGELSFFYAPDFEAPADADGDNVYEINIVATDEAGNESAMQTVTVTVEDLSDTAPIITSTEDMAEFLENYYDAIYTVEAIDADVSDTVTFRFSDDSPDAGYFMIDEHSGAIYPIMPFDHEDPQDGDGDNVYELAVIASDGVNDSDPFSLFVTVIGENDNVPVMSEETAEITVPENVDGTIYMAAASDEDVDGDPLQYIIGGADAALFYLDPDTGELSFLAPPDFEVALDDGGDNTYDVEISATDGEIASDLTAVSIVVENVSETNVIEGTPDPDTLVGTDENDVIVGFESSDTLYGGLGGDSLDGGGGKDWADYLGATDAVTVNLATGGTSGDAQGDTYTAIENIRGSDFNDTLIGNSDFNTLRGGLGADTLNGGNAADWADYTEATEGIVANLATGMGSAGEATGDLYISIENLIGSNFDDILAGNAGNNILNGFAGDDSMFGGAGNDTYIVAASGDQVTELDGQGIDLVKSYISQTLGANVENLELVGTLNINGTGNALANTLTGNAGDNVLDGGSGNDILIGGSGIDVMRGGLGGDSLDGGGGKDWADYLGATDAVTVNLATGGTSGDAQGDTYTAIENIRGSDFNDTLIGNSDFNTLRGGLGADTLNGGNAADWADYTEATEGIVANLATGMGSAGEATGDLYISIENLIGSNFDDILAGNAGNNILNGFAGDDSMFGGAGNDTYIVAASGDQVTELDGQGIDLVKSYISQTLGANVENLELVGTLNINGTGNALANTLTGNAGDNVLDGGSGNDILIGGSGSDVFQFGAALSQTSNIDTINDFSVANDSIRLEDSIFSSLTGPGVLANTRFIAGLDALDGDDNIIYDPGTGALYYDADGTGAVAKIQFATLTTGLALHEAHFFVV